ncbi:MAG: hypothetical protein P4L53_14835 [Candidatus Obscuribacterales bacterium]|nr:hypothetical protein [Candidatus Obscuribacterales bacterium]
MKRSVLLLSTILFLQFNLQLSAQASPISYSPPSDHATATMQGQLPVNKVGALLAADCLAILNGNEIKIQQNQEHDPKFKKGKAPDPNKPDLFKGEILKSKIENVGDNKTVSGIAYFSGGTRFDRLTRVKCDDTVTLTDGQSLSGIIQSADPIQLTLKIASGATAIKMSDVAAIHSARAFNFSMPVPPNTDVKNPSGFTAELNRLTLVPTCHTIAAGITKSSRNKRILIVATTLTLLATSIAVPVALSCATHHHHTTPFHPISQQPQTTLQVTPLTPVTKVVRPITVLGTKTATAAVPPTYSNTFTQIYVPPVFGVRGRLIRPGYSYYVLVQKYLGRF